MSDKLSIAYIGDKAQKRDTITGSRLIFKKGESMAVETAIARRLLEYPKVWVEAEGAQALIEANEKAAADKLEAEAKAEEDAAKQAKADSFLAKDAAGEVMDLAKLSGPQLNTLVEAEELTITTKQKPVADYRLAVRDALRAKNGAIDLDE